MGRDWLELVPGSGKRKKARGGRGKGKAVHEAAGRLIAKVEKHRRRAGTLSADPITSRHIRAQFGRQHGLCFYCGTAFRIKRETPAHWKPHLRAYFHIEHKEPISRGGSSSCYNIVLACEPCNMEKSTQTADEFMRPAFKPKVIIRKAGGKTREVSP